MGTSSSPDIAQLTINTIRGLSMDAVEAAKCGHPGMPMGAAAIGYVLFARHLRYDPEAPHWFDRDRFILSAGHGSMLLYSLLYLTGYDLSLEDIKNFRQWGSKTPGHPEHGLTPGVEATTGPLGQGFGMAVGMAIAEEKLRNEFPGTVNHRTYVLCSDGDMMEGVSHEAASIAGHLALGHLIALYDSNRVSIDGSTDLAFTENVAARFQAYGWHVQTCNGMDVNEVDACLVKAKEERKKPSLIICHTTIGFGSPSFAGTARTHGAALGAEEVKKAKEILGIPQEPPFYVPEEVLAHMREIGKKHRKERIESENKLQKYPDLIRRLECRLPECWEKDLPIFGEPNSGIALATRAASGKILNSICTKMPELLGGSADLSESTQTILQEYPDFQVDKREGRNIHYGVREHAMGCIINGINLHGAYRAFGGTFLIFSDYMRPTIRLAALMKLGSIFVFTHDSIGLGEDGPTHQPIEHLASLRAIPNMRVFRPADANETKCAWKVALNSLDAPTAIILTRQKVSLCTPDTDDAMRGAYILKEPESPPEAILIGTGSEVEICLKAEALLREQGFPVRVVSMPSWDLFAKQEKEYRDTVLPPHIKNRVSVEAGATLGWERWVGDKGVVVGLDRFGASAPYERLYKEFGLTPERIAEIVKDNAKRVESSLD
ncbi:MAG TPA: transketolase [Fimbriimonadales bacterium]|nr:transketolase [Fimbriimonadales bacterium]